GIVFRNSPSHLKALVGILLGWDHRPGMKASVVNEPSQCTQENDQPDRPSRTVAVPDRPLQEQAPKAREGAMRLSVAAKLFHLFQHAQGAIQVSGFPQNFRQLEVGLLAKGRPGLKPKPVESLGNVDLPI